MAISMSDQRKLLTAGFVLLRLELRDKKIKITRTPGTWRTYKKYPTQKACKDAWDFLMINDKAVSA